MLCQQKMRIIKGGVPPPAEQERLTREGKRLTPGQLYVCSRPLSDHCTDSMDRHHCWRKHHPFVPEPANRPIG